VSVLLLSRIKIQARRTKGEGEVRSAESCNQDRDIGSPRSAAVCCVNDHHYGAIPGSGYGFLISPCPVADPQKKGRVESGVMYVKNNFLSLREFRDLTDANQQLMAWVMQEAGNHPLLYCHSPFRA